MICAGVRDDFYFSVYSDCQRLGQRSVDGRAELGVFSAESARYVLKGAVKRDRAVFLKVGIACVIELCTYSVVCRYVAESYPAVDRQNVQRRRSNAIDCHGLYAIAAVGSDGHNNVLAGDNGRFTADLPVFSDLPGFSVGGRSYRNSSVFRLVISDVVYLFDRTEIQRQFRAVSGNGKLRIGVSDRELHRGLLHSRVREVVFIGTITHISKP